MFPVVFMAMHLLPPLQPLRNAMQLIGGPSSAVPDSFDGQLSYSVTNYLRKLKKQVGTLCHLAALVACTMVHS